MAPWDVAIARTIESPSPWWPSVLRGARTPESAKRLEQRLPLRRQDWRAGVGHGQDRPLPRAAGDEFDPAARAVVADRVVKQVHDQALEQRGIAGGRGRLEHGLNLDLVTQSLARDRIRDPACELGEIDRLAVLEPALAAGEHQQRLEQPLLVAAGREQLLARRP